MKEKFENIVVDFFSHAARAPEQIALVDGEEQLSYGELAQEVQQMAGYYQERGLRPGDRVLVFVPMSIDLYRSVLALFAFGATAVFVDEWSDAQRLEQACALANCRAFLGGWKAKAYAFFKPALRKIPLSLKPTGYKNRMPKKELFAARPESEALITFTTGSTGIPKGAQRTHGFLTAQLSAIQKAIDAQPGRSALSTLPIVQFIFLSNGMTAVLPAFNARKLAALRPEKIIKQIQDWNVEVCITSPFVAQALAKKAPISCPLQELYVGGAAVFPKAAKKLITAFPKAIVNIVYGSTEAEPISLVNAEELINLKNQRGLLVGEVHECIQLRILPLQNLPTEYRQTEELEQASLPSGTIGEIVVAGDHVLANYLGDSSTWMKNKLACAGTLWHRTGDAGFLDEDGRLWLTGRCKQLIALANNEMIAPFVVEEKLANLANVQEGTVVKKGTELHAFIVVEGGLNKQIEKEVIKNIGAKNVKLHVLNELPKDPRHHSKIDYARLLELG